MFQKKSNFVQMRRRRGDSALPQVVVLAGICFLTVLGVGIFIHFSSGRGNASTLAMHPQLEIPQEGTVEVIVPINNIPPGSGFSPQMFKKERKPEIVVGPETVRSFDELKGMYTKGVLVANRLISRDFLTSLQPVNALTASIPPGYRAIAIAVDAASSVEWWAQPGARVDVVWVTEYTGRNTASVIAHNAKVLSANRRTEALRGGARKSQNSAGKDEGIPPTVTLLLSMQDTMKVRLAALHGKLSLVLRGAEDTGGIASSGSIHEASLYGDINEGQVAPQRKITVVTVKDPASGKVEELKFERGYRIDQ
jgi:pilus assembly protein CpaB